MEIADYGVLKKRLLYKSNNRGWKETDILLGEFAKRNIDLLNHDQLEMFDILLDEPDVEIFNWITKKTPVPKKYDNELMLLLQQFELN